MRNNGERPDVFPDQGRRMDELWGKEARLDNLIREIKEKMMNAVGDRRIWMLQVLKMAQGESDG